MDPPKLEIKGFPAHIYLFKVIKEMLEKSMKYV